VKHIIVAAWTNLILIAIFVIVRIISWALERYPSVWLTILVVSVLVGCISFFIDYFKES
jgi:uncharacterized membrane protein